MKLRKDRAPRERAQELAWDAMEFFGVDHERAAELCREALRIYPECVDAMGMLAELESVYVRDYVKAMRHAVEAGRRDLGSDYFKHERGNFWGLLETRPFMRVMALLADSLVQWGTDERIDEAIRIIQEMLELNPNDNQGVRDLLVGCYLQRKRYDDAGDLLNRYNNAMAVWNWAWVLLAHATRKQESLARLLKEAREQNPFVELYLTGQKRRPRTRPGYYVPGEETEAVFCANALWGAWQKHTKSKRWLKEVVLVRSKSSRAS